MHPAKLPAQRQKKIQQFFLRYRPGRNRLSHKTCADDTNTATRARKVRISVQLVACSKRLVHGIFLLPHQYGTLCETDTALHQIQKRLT